MEIKIPYMILKILFSCLFADRNGHHQSLHHIVKCWTLC